MNEILYKLYFFLFLFNAISCSTTETDIVEENNSLDIKRMEVNFSLLGQFIFDQSNINGWQRNDTLFTNVKDWAALKARVSFFEQKDNEMRDLEVYLERYSRRYQIFMEPIDLNMEISNDDQDHDGFPLGLRWNWRTRGIDSGFLRVILVEDLDKSTPIFQEGAYDGSSGTIIFDMTFPVQIGEID